MKFLLIIVILMGVSARALAFQILFTNRPSGTDHIYVMTEQGTNVTQLTNDTSSDTGPMHWSWDGTKIVFSRSGRLYKMNADGTGQTAYPAPPGGTQDQFPSWSPDGTKILFSRVNGNGGGRPFSYLYTMSSVDGSSATPFLGNGTGGCSLDTNCNLFLSAKYSPDSTKILYESDLNKSQFSFEIYTCTASSCASSVTALTSITGIAADPEYSPDGTKIAYSCAIASTGGNVNTCVMNANGSSQTQITSFTCPIEGADPGWSPNGTKIAFEYDTGIDGIHCLGQSDNAAPTDIWTMNADGSSEVTTGRACSNIGCSPKYQPGSDNSGSNGVHGGSFW